MEKKKRKEKKKTHLGPVFIVLPSPASSSIDHIPILLLPVLVCWNQLLPVVVEGDKRGGRLWNHQLEHGSCDLLMVGLNDLKKNIKKISSHSSPLSTNHMIMCSSFTLAKNYINFFRMPEAT